MPTTNLNRKLLDLKRWEICAPTPANSGTGSCIISSNCHRQLQLAVLSTSAMYLYDPFEDGWIAVPTSGGPTVGAGTSGVCSMRPRSLSAYSPHTGGAISFRTLANPGFLRDLRGYKVICTSAANAANKGVERTIASNTAGSFITITLSSAFPADITSGDTFDLYTPRFYVTSANSQTLRFYDYASDLWVSGTNLPYTTGTTDSRLVATPSMINGEFKYFDNGTVDSWTTGASFYITDLTKNWTANQWAGHRVRILTGGGGGYQFVIQSNTADTLTAFGVHTTSGITAGDTYVIEADNSKLYYLTSVNTQNHILTLGSDGTTVATSSMGPRLTGTYGSGMTGQWIHTSGDATWADPSAIVDGQRIYSFRGNNSNGLEYYEIHTNTWFSVTVHLSTIALTGGSKSVRIGKYIYFTYANQNYWYRYDVVTREVQGVGYMHVVQGTATVGDTAFDVTYKDGATEISYIYMLLNTSNQMYRMMVI